MTKILVTTILVWGFCRSGAWGGGVGLYGGRMDTADFGQSKVAGVKIEADLISVAGLELRGGYAYDFRQKDLGVEDFEMYFAEAGARLRLPLGPFFSLHAGAGGGYYILPAFDAVNPEGRVLRSDLSDTGGLYGLAGAEAGLRNVRLFAEVKYLFLRPGTVKADFEEEWIRAIDTDLSGVSVLVGALIRW